MKIFLKFAIFAAALWALSFVPVFAAIEQTDGSASSTNFNSRWSQMLGTNLLGDVTDVVIKVGRPGQASGGGAGSVSVKICEFSTALDAENANDCASPVWESSRTFASTGSDTLATFTDTTYTLDPTKYYFVRVSCDSNGGCTIWGSNDDEAYRDAYHNVNVAGFASTNDSATGYNPAGDEPSLNQGTDANVHDIYFVIADAAEGVDATIAWNSPTQDEAMSGWPTYLSVDVTANYPFCGDVQGIVNSYVGRLQNACFPVGTTRYNYSTPGPATTSVSQANIAIYDPDFDTFATSTITFRALSAVPIQNVPALDPLAPSNIDPTASSSIFFVDCSAYQISLFSSSSLQGIGCIAKKTALDVLATLFVPNPSVLQRYAALSIEDKFPFAYWYSLQSTFESVNSSSTAAFPSLSLQMFPSSTMGWSLTASFSSSTVSSYLGSTMISLFRTLMQAALWLAFAYFVYRKLKAIFDHDNTTA